MILMMMLVAVVPVLVYGKSSNSKNQRAVTKTSSTNPLEALQSRFLEGVKPPKLPQQHRPTKLTGYGSRRHHRHHKRHKQSEANLLLYPCNETSSEGEVQEGWIVQHKANESSSDSDNNQAVQILPGVGQEESLRIQALVNHPPPKNQDSSSIPVEGLFGVYSLPSGQLWVWIAQSKSVYQAPHPESTRNWWDIRKVDQLHLVFLPSTTNKNQNRAQIQEEKRQLALLRQALKDHDWYFCPRSTTCCVTDMTHNLQHCFQRQQQQEKSSQPHWFDVVPSLHGNHPCYPERRFFWNEGVLEPLLGHYRHFVELEKASSETDPTKEEPAPPSLLASRWLLDMAIPVTSAFVGVQQSLQIDTSTNSTTTAYEQLLISRRSRWRAGTRFTKRGADATGNVANYAETEQVLFLLNGPDSSCQHVCSHVQTRGSIPLRWSSPTDIKTYRPRVRIGTDPLAQARAMRQHLLDETSRYILDADENSNQMERKHPALVMVNLVDKKSDQGRLGRAMDSVLVAILDVYEKYDAETKQQVTENTTTEKDGPTAASDLVQTEDMEQSQPHLNSKTIRHDWFDFHAEVKGGRWDRLKSLLSDIQPALDEQSFFEAKYDSSKHDWKVERLQTGVVRTNCMDCLDRTNVVQSMFGRQVLFAQLQAASLPKPLIKSFRLNPLSLPWEAGEVAHRSLWADNADAISRMYAGTPALKGDFTRTGKRTKKGALDDGVNSIQRYYLNNFLDADRQEGIDLLTRHQEFAELDNGDEDGNDDESLSSQASSNQSTANGGMNIQDAARQLLMGGTWGSLKDNKEGAKDDDESSFVRAKLDRKHRGGAFSLKKKKKPALNLLWLPGDLQEQMRSLAAWNNDDQDHLPLRAMDQRAAQDMPWWAIHEDSSEDETSVDTSEREEDDGSDDPQTTDGPLSGSLIERVDANHAGFVVAALVASTKAPLATAAVVLGIASLSLSVPTSTEDEQP